MASRLPSLPSLPSSRRARPSVACACGGCGRLTQSTWYPGHDGHCMGWAERVHSGAMALADVPDMVRAGAANRLALIRAKEAREAKTA